MNQKGFSQVILLGMVAVLILAGVGGFLVLREKKVPSSGNEKTAQQEVFPQKTGGEIQPAFGNLCSGEDGCNDFCKNNLGRCKEYCLHNPQNELCKSHFSLEAKNQSGKSWEPYTELQKPEPQVVSSPTPPPQPPPPPPSLHPPKIIEQFTIAEPQEWIPDVMTQPVPKGASQTRLVLPAPVNKILLKTLGTFGAHQGAHIEGLNHEWIGIKNDIPIGSWGDGTVTRLNSNNGMWKLRINFGDGLFGEYMEIKTPLVKVGDTVKARQPIGYGITLQRDPEYQSGEFVLGDAHRQDGVRSWVTSGSAVSPFDYLEDTAKQELVDAFTKEVIEPYIAKGQMIETITSWEPYLTNPMFLHKNHKGTLVGEWLLMNKKWNEKDPASYEVITFLKSASTKYYPRQRAMGISSDTINDRLTTYFGGDVDIDYIKKNFSIYTNDGVIRGIFELDESGPRAKFKTEYRLRGSYPESFSENALIYIERQPIGVREDAVNLGMLEKL